MNTILSSMNRILFAFSVFFVLSVSSCQSEVQREDIQNNAESYFFKFFNAQEQAAILAIKATFDKGINRDFEWDDISRAYDYHAKTIRIDLLNGVPFTLTYPYDGTFDFQNYTAELNQLPFITNECGFQNAETKQKINYYCLNLEQRYFDYLQELSKSSSFIANFAEAYQKSKSLTPTIKEKLLFSAKEELDFMNLDHQQLYMWLHLLASEEIMAMHKYKQLPKW